MPNYYLKRGNTFVQTDAASLDITDKLPAGTYTLKMDPTGAFYYEVVDNFTLPKKVYGDLAKNTDRIIRTFVERPNGTGVLLSGEKGSGKTLLAKSLSVAMYNRGCPTIVINTPFHGDSFNAFVQEMEQEAIILFDEFEKVYSPEEQQSLLTLLDGVYPTKKLFVITNNNKYRIDEHMRNRPGRMYYAIDYTGLSPEFIREYATDVLLNKDNVESVVNVAALFSEFNFDMLAALCEEMNRYNETAQESMALLNTKPDTRNNNSEFTYSYFFDGVELKQEEGEDCWTGNPLVSGVAFYYYKPDTPKGGKLSPELAKLFGSLNDDEEDEGGKYVNFHPTDIVKIDGETGTFIFDKKNGETLKLVRKKAKEVDYTRLF